MNPKRLLITVLMAWTATLVITVPFMLFAPVPEPSRTAIAIGIAVLVGGIVGFIRGLGEDL